MLSEARKYNLQLVLANQFTAQLSGKVSDAIFGNVFSMVAFRLGVDDARFMDKALPGFTAEDLQNLDIGKAIMRCGKAEDCFSVTTTKPPTKPETHFVEAIIEHSRQTYGIPINQIVDQPKQAGPPIGEDPTPPPEDIY